MRLAALLLSGLAASAGATDCLTFHYDNARLGWNRQERILTADAVRSGLTLRWRAPLDGGVRGSPLYVGSLRRAFAATERNSVFAVDARTGRVVWSRRELARPLTPAEFSGSWFGRQVHGILSTPVISPDRRTIYVCGPVVRGLRQHYAVWALDTATGKTRSGYPVRIRARDGGREFVGGEVMQRGALSLVGGWLYVPFGGRGDTPPWRGWVVGLNTRNPKAPTRAFCASPEQDGAGIWSGGGLAAEDATGALWAVTGNGTTDHHRGGRCAAQSVLRLVPKGDRLTYARNATGFYTPRNYQFLDDQDEDLGGATAILLPPVGGRRYVATGGKDGLGYLLSAGRPGGLGGELWKGRLFCPEPAVYHEGIRATPAYFDGGSGVGPLVVIAGDQAGPDGVKGLVALRVPSMARLWTLDRDLNGPGSPVVSGEGAQAVVWTVETNEGDGSRLWAHRAATGEPLLSGENAPTFEGGRRFVSPTVVDGQVLVGADGLRCYGLREER